MSILSEQKPFSVRAVELEVAHEIRVCTDSISHTSAAWPFRKYVRSSHGDFGLKHYLHSPNVAVIIDIFLTETIERSLVSTA
ncbi:MAG: hypothetical protein ACR2PG_21635 [Hyphomicrobiaceae bacterium]